MYCEWISSSLAPPLLSEITDLLPKPAFRCASGCRFFRQSHCLYHRKTTRSYKDYIGLYLDVIYHSLRSGGHRKGISALPSGCMECPGKFHSTEVFVRLACI